MTGINFEGVFELITDLFEVIEEWLVVGRTIEL